jgi:peptidoglycan/xylan/chitin deacetylase (PgdA/CDA1 family)
MDAIKFFNHILLKIPSYQFFINYSNYYSKDNLGMVVTLHSVQKGRTTSGVNSFIEISEFRFEQTIQHLKKLNVRFVTLKELEQELDKKEHVARRQPLVHISFDDGYLDTFTLAYPILKKHGIPFSVFIVSDYINNPHPFLWWYMIACILEHQIPVCFEKYDFSITEEQYKKQLPEELFLLFRSFLIEKVDSDRDYVKAVLEKYFPATCALPGILEWSQLNEMIQSGLCEVGVHTKSHPRFGFISDEQKLYEINHCKEAIEQHTGITPVYFAYPYGGKEDIGETSCLAKIMDKTGMRMALTTIPAELSRGIAKHLVPRVFLNNASTLYSLKARLTGMYQRERL